MAIKPKELWNLLKETFNEWNEDEAPRLSAALAYYTVFSLAPLLIITLFVIGVVWGNQVAETRTEILAQIERFIGEDAAGIIETMLDNTEQPGSGGVLATVLGVGALLFGATGAFVQLQGVLNRIWEVMPRPGQGIKGMLKSRLLSFGLILLTGLLLLGMLIAGTVISSLNAWMGDRLPGSTILIRLLDLSVTFGLMTLLFAMIYRYLPDVIITWRDVWIGAVITALLFALGKFGISQYLAYSSPASTYGAAGSLAVLLVWIYYSALIFLFGAELTQVYARRYGTRIRPAPYAMRIPNFYRLAEAPETPPALPETHAQTSRPPLPPRRSSALQRIFPVALAFFVGRWIGKR